MGKSLTEIARQLKDANKKVQLIYAFNGVGKTRLSGEFKQLISPKSGEEDGAEDHGAKILYYNAFTEDLFYWNNDLDNDIDRRIIIQPNSFTDWLLRDEGQENEISKQFSHYTNAKLSPKFNEDFSEVRFSFLGGDDASLDNIKISKSEESNFVWCIFYVMLKLVIDELNTEKTNRSTDQFDNLEYIFIDDPVTSLDENHLIELAVDLSQLIKSNTSDVKFVITTHNPLFYNVLYNEFNKNANRSRLVKFEDGTYNLKKQEDDSPFSYHLYLLSELKKIAESDEIQKYHFNMLRNILEKTSTFLGYKKWSDLLVQNNKNYQARLINISSHSKLSSAEVASVTEEDKNMLKELVNLLTATYHFHLPPADGDATELERHNDPLQHNS